MKKILLTSTCLLMAASAVLAQSETPSTSQDTPAIAPSTTNPGAPVQGKNSFTEDQVRSRLAAGGFGTITDLKLDDQGVWRASAVKDNKPVRVALDYQGNIVAK
ncbi:PepSY domain-containing protein [Rhizobium rhizogenes]|uniref:PepSY domain-containing protein n=1 Tax=Rhizobium rhizogenes TaxID=359 RepID=UPI001574C8A1|nr:PepSY domain-containing protein [Rhizobium rhizogenes]NTI33021.1 PepSY domain-containing protein [Rhizobium rhizogenes]